MRFSQKLQKYVVRAFMYPSMLFKQIILNLVSPIRSPHHDPP